VLLEVDQCDRSQNAETEHNQCANDRAGPANCSRRGSMHKSTNASLPTCSKSIPLPAKSICSMNRKRILPPLTGDPNPATRPAFPVTFHPDCRRSRTRNPTARHPFVTRASPPPITARPNITRTRRNRSRFNSHRRRRLRN